MADLLAAHLRVSRLLVSSSAALRPGALRACSGTRSSSGRAQKSCSRLQQEDNSHVHVRSGVWRGAQDHLYVCMWLMDEHARIVGLWSHLSCTGHHRTHRLPEKSRCMAHERPRRAASRCPERPRACLPVRATIERARKVDTRSITLWQAAPILQLKVTRYVGARSQTRT